MNRSREIVGTLALSMAMAATGCQADSSAAGPAGAEAPLLQAEVPAASATPAAERREPEQSAPNAREGFAVHERDGRLWVFKTDSEDYREFQEKGWPAKNVRRIGEGPDGMTLIAPDIGTIEAYKLAVDGTVSQAVEPAASGPQQSAQHARKGFAVYEWDGRLWVFKTDSDDFREFQEKGWPAKNVRRIGEGPDGMTLIAPDVETIEAYKSARR